MSQLYTVEMVRKKTVYSYDPHTGARVNEREELLTVIIHDLPRPTALAYQFKFPSAGVKITQQAYSSDVVRHSSKRDYYERADDAPSALTSEDQVREDKTDDVVAAAISGNFAAAINAEAA
jgi:hypothetical protein